MTLFQKQVQFSKLLPLLLNKIFELGYEVTLGEAFRTKEQAKLNALSGAGISNSLHCDRLAIDLNLFKDGKFLTKSEDYKVFGEFWEKLSGPDFVCYWGGRFNDGNHFSIGHGGRK